MAKKPSDQFSPGETKQRMEAALRGSRISGHKPMSEIAPKRKKKATPNRSPSESGRD